jgi:catechol 2,3-dioxygenase-like lactoylglutathione lyase family enzyme
MSGGPISLRGLSHLALNCSSMARTVEFYEKLGLPLVKTLDVPGGMGQHFFFDIGNGECLAFFYWDAGGPGEAGISHPRNAFAPSADGAMHHVAIAIDRTDIIAMRDRLVANDVDFAFVAHNVVGRSGTRIDDIGDDTFAASFYLTDPDGLIIEFCAWLPAWDRVGRDHDPTTGRVALPI